MEEYQDRPGYLYGAIISLRIALEEILPHIPDAAKQAVNSRLADHARLSEESADRKGRDDLRDYASAAYEMSEKFSEVVNDLIAEKR